LLQNLGNIFLLLKTIAYNSPACIREHNIKTAIKTPQGVIGVMTFVYRNYAQQGKQH